MMTLWELQSKIRIRLERRDVGGAVSLILPQGANSTTVFNRPSSLMTIESMQQNVGKKLEDRIPIPDIAEYIIQVGVNSEIANRVA